MGRWGDSYLLKYSFILSFDTFSGRLPTHRCLVSLTMVTGLYRDGHWRGCQTVCGLTVLTLITW